MITATKIHELFKDVRRLKDFGPLLSVEKLNLNSNKIESNLIDESEMYDGSFQ